MNIHDRIPSVDFLNPGETTMWKVERYEVTENQARTETSRLRYQIQQGRATMGSGRLYAGTYTRLMTHTHMGWDVVMSDVLDEKLEHENIVQIATGRVLLNGLGLGMVLNAILLKPDVEQVVVVEKSLHVLSLVGSQYRLRMKAGVYPQNYLNDKRLVLVNNDAFLYNPGAHVTFNVVWHDIWPALSTENLKQITKLKRKYARRLVTPGKWQGAWAEGAIRVADRIARRNGL